MLRERMWDLFGGSEDGDDPALDALLEGLAGDGLVFDQERVGELTLEVCKGIQALGQVDLGDGLDDLVTFAQGVDLEQLERFVEEGGGLVGDE